MMKLFQHIRGHRVLAYAPLVIWLTVGLASVQPVLAGVGCLADKTGQHMQQAKHCACCESGVRCDCELNQGNSANAPEQTLALTLRLSNVVNKDIVFSHELSTIIPHTERKTTDDRKVPVRGPSVSVYLQTLNLLC